MFNEKLNSPIGVGVGSLFSGLFREVIPVSKSAIDNLKKVMDNKSMKIIGKTLEEEATNTAANETLKYLTQKNIKKSKKHQLKKIAKNILSAAKHNKSILSSDSNKKKNNKLSSLKKRNAKQIKGPKNKKSVSDVDT